MSPASLQLHSSNKDSSLMKNKQQKLAEKIKPYHFELKHLLVLFLVLIVFQALVSFVHKISLRNFLLKTQEWYQQDSAERIANLTATSLELMLETNLQNRKLSDTDERKIVQAFNIILSQQILQQHVQEVCLLITGQNRTLVIDNGQVLFSYIFRGLTDVPQPDVPHPDAIRYYAQVREQLIATEQICSIVEGRQTFHVFVPFAPRGEHVGAVYMKNTPDFAFISSQIISSYNETSLIFTALIFFGLLAMFYISSYTVKERDETQGLLFQERAKQLEERIHFQKEALFTKRIYHTHHKAEKVMGFIKEDLLALNGGNTEEIRYRVTKYANFISRVIYDMKWYDPPLQTVRNPLFQTNLNEVIRFIVRSLFLRISDQAAQFEFKLELDDRLPNIHINEFVVWEVLEPLLQNCIEHSGEGAITIAICTRYYPESGQMKIFIADNGKGFRADLLETDGQGIKRIFLENVTTKVNSQNSGYGCYIAYEISKQRCGWNLDAENLPRGGAQFTVTVPTAA